MYLDHPEYIQYREQFEQTKMMKNVRTDEFELNQYSRSLLVNGIQKEIIQDHPIPILISFAFIPIITLIRLHFSNIIKINEKEIINAYEIAWKAIAK